MKKYFIITIDTEGDNLWAWNGKDKIKTDNTLYLGRFQNLCNQYGFKPVWLTNYEMISDSRYVDFISSVVETGTGEIGMHLHAWNSPPFYELEHRKDGKTGKPYLIEYPKEVMYEKIHLLSSLIQSRTGTKPVSHRAGRWATNQNYFELLMEEGYKVDCSVTPSINWANMPGYTSESCGTNYEKNKIGEFFINSSKSEKQILEVPVSIKKTHSFIRPEETSAKGFIGSVYRAINGQSIWLRPTRNNLNRMLWLANEELRSDGSYLMFMLHSSEFMPGGNPIFRNSTEIDNLYNMLEVLFSFISKTYIGITLEDFEEKIRKTVLYDRKC